MDKPKIVSVKAPDDSAPKDGQEKPHVVSVSPGTSEVLPQAAAVEAEALPATKETGSATPAIAQEQVEGAAAEDDEGGEARDLLDYGAELEKKLGRKPSLKEHLEYVAGKTRQKTDLGEAYLQQATKDILPPSIEPKPLVMEEEGLTEKEKEELAERARKLYEQKQERRGFLAGIKSFLGFR